MVGMVVALAVDKAFLASPWYPFVLVGCCLVVVVARYIN
jgi:F0F1-type ATP synthase assembly protein I